jgi:hypothetical protein
MIPNPLAFVKSGTFEKVIEAFKRTTQLTVQGGSVAHLATGQRVVSLGFDTGNHKPFQATSGTAERIKIERGFVTYAGRSFYFPAAVYSGSAPGGVFLKITTGFTVGLDDEDNEFTVIQAAEPELVWRPNGTVGAYCILQYDDTFVLTAGAPEDLYIPIAGWSGTQVVNYVSQNIFLIPSGSNGTIDYTGGWG